ncbi:hypothetical protein LZ30DRAFT_710466 [Colletotrichum cereale]|nr:hypothetical protein LZ30DRAFT_710466 [Colletotrichum cereale]
MKVFDTETSISLRLASPQTPLMPTGVGCRSHRRHVGCARAVGILPPGPSQMSMCRCQAQNLVHPELFLRPFLFCLGFPRSLVPPTPPSGKIHAYVPHRTYLTTHNAAIPSLTHTAIDPYSQQQYLRFRRDNLTRLLRPVTHMHRREPEDSAHLQFVAAIYIARDQ